MTTSALKALVARQSFVEKAKSPYARDLDRIIPLKVEGFEHIGEQIAAVGIDERTGERIKVFRAWANNPRNERQNPLLAAAERVKPGGIMLFTEASKIEVDGHEDAWGAEDFATVINDNEEHGFFLVFDEPVFVDPVETEDGKHIQIYNILQVEESTRVESPKDFFDAMMKFFKSREGMDDSVIIRGYSEADKIASSVRIHFDADTPFQEAMGDLLAHDLPMDMVGDEEGTFEVNGKDLVSSIGGEATGTSWEIIPVTGIRKNLSPKNSELAAKLQAMAKTLTSEFTFSGEVEQSGYRKSIVGMKVTTLSSGQPFTDVVRLYHEKRAARPLAIVNTPHHPNIERVFSEYNKPEASQTPDSPGVNFEEYINQLAETLDFEGFDLLDEGGVAAAFQGDLTENELEFPDLDLDEIGKVFLELDAASAPSAAPQEEEVLPETSTIGEVHPEMQAPAPEKMEGGQAEDIDMAFADMENLSLEDLTLKEAEAETPDAAPQEEDPFASMDGISLSDISAESEDPFAGMEDLSLADLTAEPEPKGQPEPPAPAAESLPEPKAEVATPAAARVQSEPEKEVKVQLIPMVRKEQEIDFLSTLTIEDEAIEETPKPETLEDLGLDAGSVFSALGLGA